MTSSSPRRAGLAQGRSRDTRRKLIRTAMDLWNDRGFDEAFEAITVEEIARTAGVSKGTFYFHFGSKDEILLELAWSTAWKMVEDVDAGIRRNVPLFSLVDTLMKGMARRVARTPKAAVHRVVGQWSRMPADVVAKPAGVGVGFEALIRYGQQSDVLPESVDVYELAGLLHAATLDALVRWASSDQSNAGLAESLSRRADVVLRGAVASYRRD